MKIAHISALLFLLTAVWSPAKTNPEADETMELAKRRILEKSHKEIRELTQTIQRTHELMKQDSIRHSIALEGVRRRQVSEKNFQAELQTRKSRARLVNDSLEAQKVAIEDRMAMAVAERKGALELILGHAEKWEQNLMVMVPLAAEKNLATLRVLIREIRVDQIEPQDAAARLLQIQENTKDVARSITVVQGSCPVNSLGNKCWRLRYGNLGEYALAETGKGWAVWMVASAESGWQVRNEVDAYDAIWNAIQVNRGKEIPGLVMLPIPVGEKQ